MKQLKIRMRFTEPVLGSRPGNPELLRDHIASKAPDLANAKEEVAVSEEALATHIDTEMRKGMTVFDKDATGMFMWDYQIRGAIKEAVGILVEAGQITTCTKYTHKRVVDTAVFVRGMNSARRIYLMKPDGTHWTETKEVNERPLRASTMQGDRVAIARSEQLPAGTWMEFKVELLTGSRVKKKKGVEEEVAFGLTEEDIQDVFNYSGVRGFGQWRGGGWGLFTFSLWVYDTDTKQWELVQSNEDNAKAA